MTDLPEISPRDEHNTKLVQNVHPSDWTNPTPQGRYNLVVIGAGSAGLITAAIAAGLGAKVALIERHYLGGDCLNVGCVPSKGVIRASRMVAEARRAQKEVGLALADGAKPDFALAMERMRRVRAQISDEDAAKRYSEELGVDVYLGNGRFTSSSTVDVDGTTLEFKKAVIATGARAIALPIEGLPEAGYLTNETISFLRGQADQAFAFAGTGVDDGDILLSIRRFAEEDQPPAVGDHLVDAHALGKGEIDGAGWLFGKVRWFAIPHAQHHQGCEHDRADQKGNAAQNHKNLENRGHGVHFSCSFVLHGCHLPNPPPKSVQTVDRSCQKTSPSRPKPTTPASASTSSWPPGCRRCPEHGSRPWLRRARSAGTAFR